MTQGIKPSRYTASVSQLTPESFGAQGWRSFFSYRDLGIREATGDDYNFRIVRAGRSQPESTGWHYHVCEIQVVYCLGGWEIIALEDGRVVKLVPGTCLNIPPGYVHNEVGYAPDMEMFVMNKPGTVDTVPVDMPEGWRPLDAPEGWTDLEIYRKRGTAANAAAPPPKS